MNYGIILYTVIHIPNLIQYITNHINIYHNFFKIYNTDSRQQTVSVRISEGKKVGSLPFRKGRKDTLHRVGVVGV